MLSAQEVEYGCFPYLKQLIRRFEPFDGKSVAERHSLETSNSALSFKVVNRNPYLSCICTRNYRINDKKNSHKIIHEAVKVFPQKCVDHLHAAIAI